MPQTFSETLLGECAADWQAAIGHRFVRELLAGCIDDAVMARYLVQDHRFLDAFLTLLGAAIASADRFESRLRFGRFAGMVSGDENDYFLRAFAELGVGDDARAAAPDRAATKGFQWPRGSISTGRGRRQACPGALSMPSGSRCTIIRSFAISSPFFARNWIVSARASRGSRVISFIVRFGSSWSFSKMLIVIES
jgi:hypothetical protein